MKGTVMDRRVVLIVVLLAGNHLLVGGQPGLSDLLDRYAQSRNRFDSLIVRTEIREEANNLLTATKEAQKYSGHQRRLSMEEYRSDGTRMCLRGTHWEHGDLDERFTPIGPRKYTSYLWDGEKLTRYATVGEGLSDQGRVHLTKRLPEAEAQKRLAAGWNFGFFLGALIPGGDQERLDVKLRKAPSATLSDRMEPIGGTDCYVVSAITEAGRLKVWIDPTHGYSLARAEVRHLNGDMVDGRKIVGEISTTFEVSRFEQVDGIWAPKEGTTTSSRTYKNGDYERRTAHVRVTQVRLNPDHEALRSFLPDDIPNGTPARMPEVYGVTYTWQDGELIPNVDRAIVGDIERIVREMEAQSKPVEASPRSSLPPEVRELLVAYGRSLDLIQSLTAAGETQLERFDAAGVKVAVEQMTCIFTSDGDRVSLRTQPQGDVTRGAPHAGPRPGYAHYLWDDARAVYFRIPRETGEMAAYVKPHDRDKMGMIATMYLGAPLMGLCAGDTQRLDRLLMNAARISLRPAPEVIDGASCLVIEALTRNGTYTVWLDPTHGHLPARVEIRRSRNTTAGTDGPSAGRSLSFVMEDVRFHRVPGAWVPAEARMQTKAPADASYRTVWRHRRRSIVVNPKLDAGAFTADDIPEGTRVYLEGDERVYQWQEGEFVLREKPDAAQ